MLTAALGSAAAVAEADTITYNDFSDVSGLTLNGDAAQVGTSLQIVPDEGDRRGSVWITRPLSTGSFSSRSRIFMRSGYSPADGMTFVIQGVGPTALGLGDNFLGYQGLASSGIAPSVAVVLDTYPCGYLLGIVASPEWPDGCRMPNTVSNAFPIGQAFTMWVDYDASTKVLSVFTSLTDDKPTQPALSTTVPLDIGAKVGPQGYFGFTASTGGLSMEVDLNSWSLETTPLPGDTTAPTVTVTAPTDGATYKLGQTVAAGYACEDEAGGSGIDTCVGTVADGANLDTATVGTKTFTVDAADNEGNTSSKSVSYRVVYDFAGFYEPVDGGGVLNSLKAGSAVAVKFSLAGNQGLAILAAGSPSSQPIACDSSAPSDPVESTVTAGSSSLSYDAITGRYTYVWKTDRAWALTCRQLSVKLVDGTVQTANFRFTK